jgi:hypothetical protein
MKELFKSIGRERALASALVLIYQVAKRDAGVPQTTQDLWKHGHDGLNWQLFVPLARDLLSLLAPEEPAAPPAAAEPGAEP